MLHKTWERNQVYRRRLYVVVPIAIILVIVIFATSDQVSVEEIEKHIGWKGELEVVPEISIVFDDDSEVMPERERKLFTMKSIDLDLPEGGDIAERQLQQAERPEQEDIDWAEWDEFQIRTRQSNRDVPYSQEYVILSMVEPNYPPEEHKNGVEGNVLVELFVNDAGKVEDATILSWLGPKSFRDSTLAAVTQFRFQPPVRDGKPSSMWIKFMVRFRLFG